MPRSSVDDDRPVLFFDVDGVLNHRAVVDRTPGRPTLCVMAAARFRFVVEETNCLVVLVSTWRHDEAKVALLRDARILEQAHPEWRTGRAEDTFSEGGIIVSTRTRGREIAQWLTPRPGTRYAVVDDEVDHLDEQLPFLVKTKFDHGLQDEHVRRLIDLLSKR